MRILIVGINFSPELTGIGKYNGEMARWFAAKGHEVRVVTAPPYYPEWKVAKDYSGWRYGREKIDGVTVFRCPLWVPSRPSGLKRILHLASFALSSFLVMLGQMLWKPDVVFVVEPPLFCSPGALLAATLCGAKTWLHVQDFEIDAAFELGLIRGNWMRRFALRMEHWLMACFDRVSSISPKMRDRLIEKGVANAVLLPNWVDLDEIYPLQCRSEFRVELGIDQGVCVALYSGNMGEKQGLEILLAAAHLLEDHPEVLFLLCGDGSARDKLVQQSQGMKNLIWLPLQPVERLNGLLNLADVHLLPQRIGVGDLMMPSKLLGMLASGKPVLAMAEQGTQLQREVSGCGVVLPPGDVDGLAVALLELAGRPELRDRMGNSAREAAIKWSKEEVLREFERELQ